MLRDVNERARLDHARGIKVLKSQFDYIPHFRHEKTSVRYDGKKTGWVKTEEAFRAGTFVPKKL